MGVQYSKSSLLPYKVCMYVDRVSDPIVDDCQCLHWCTMYKVSKGAKIRNRYNQVPHLTQDNRGYPGTGIMEGDCTHNPEDWKNKSIK